MPSVLQVGERRCHDREDSRLRQVAISDPLRDASGHTAHLFAADPIHNRQRLTFATRLYCPTVSALSFEKMNVPTPQRRSHMIRKLASGEYRLYSRKTDPKTGKRRNLGTFDSREKAEQHEREVQYFKRH